MPNDPLTPEIRTLPQTLLVGHYLEMNVLSDRTRELWMGFGPQIKQIAHRANPNRYSLEVYPDPDYFNDFDPNKKFQKWAAVAVTRAEDLPVGIEVLDLTEGQYAVFTYRQRMAPPQEFYRRIYMEWLPQSGLKLAHRPHIAIMGPEYDPTDPDSDETLWIPVQA
ncbi:AraC family transcriptional regulator [Robiginitalea myxolifaciens]|uniref:AraC family transcriptional regulator n=1 Tax=Robiginitalea myxolifaciens TaxID=400055 RepID=A0A1I6FNF5_9FLAO|nr:GyrI-like domain-containing protein [Robiginitalea myxolifaciens]SFR31481.1 AraC family transcriptional regulator [Robiginitalea myxolifaciens]